MGYPKHMFLKLSQRIKTPWAAAVFIAVALVGIAGSLRWPLSKDFIASRLQYALADNSGFELESLQDAAITMLPWPSLHISNLALKNTRMPNERVTIPVVKARLNVASWISGKPKIVALSLFDPALTTVSKDNISDVDVVSSIVATILSDNARTPLRTFRVQGGTVKRDGAEWLKNINVSMSNVVSADMRLRASADYQEIPFQVMADIARHSSSQERSISWTVATSFMSARFAGMLLGLRGLDAEGQFNLSISDGERLAARLKLENAQAAMLNGLKLSGQTRIALPTIQIRSAMIERGLEKLQGSVEMTLDAARPQFLATLDSKSLDVTPLLAPLTAKLAPEGNGWSTQKLRTAWLKAAIVDIRLSATRLALGPHAVEFAALSARLNAGRMEFMLSDGRLNNGTVKARSVVTLAGDDLDIRAQASFERVDIGGFFEAVDSTRVRGLASGQFNFETVGGSVARLVEAAEGRSSLAIKDGELAGIDFERIVNRLERPLTRAIVPPNLVEGRTRFQNATAQMRLSGGKLTLNDSWMATLNLRVPFEGTIAIDQRLVDLTARLLPGGEISKVGDIRVRIEGPWANPAIYPDMTGRLNRS